MLERISIYKINNLNKPMRRRLAPGAGGRKGVKERDRVYHRERFGQGSTCRLEQWVVAEGTAPEEGDEP